MTQGEVLTDWVSGCQLRDTPEARLVQVIAQWVVSLGYSKEQIQTFPQYAIQGSRNNYRVDLAVFTDTSRTDDNIILIAECKSALAGRGGLGQLQRYLKLTSAVAGVWFDGNDLEFLFHMRNMGRFLEASQTQVPDSFSSHVRLRRLGLCEKDKSFSLRQVASRIGVEPSYLSKIENGDVPAPRDEILRALALDLGEDPNVLFARAGRVPPEFSAILMARAAFLGPFLQELKDIPDQALAKVARKVRDGKW
jgi:transcriptional regulator with XRE-family HTH domain